MNGGATDVTIQASPDQTVSVVEQSTMPTTYASGYTFPKTGDCSGLVVIALIVSVIASGLMMLVSRGEKNGKIAK